MPLKTSNVFATLRHWVIIIADSLTVNINMVNLNIDFLRPYMSESPASG